MPSVLPSNSVMNYILEMETPLPGLPLNLHVMIVRETTWPRQRLPSQEALLCHDLDRQLKDTMGVEVKSTGSFADTIMMIFKNL